MKGWRLGAGRGLGALGREEAILPTFWAKAPSLKKGRLRNWMGVGLRDAFECR